MNQDRRRYKDETEYEKNHRHHPGSNRLIIVLLAVLLLALAAVMFWLLGSREGTEKIAYETAAPEVVIPAAGDQNSGEIVLGLDDYANSAEELAEAGPEEEILDAASPNESEGMPENSEISLLFAGDVLLSDYVLNAYDNAGGIGGVLDEQILQTVQGADYFMVNQEFPFSDRGTAAEDKQFTFRLPPSRVNLLQEMGIDMVTLANNHALDFGTDALLDTGSTLDAAGIRYVGAGENLERAKRLETVEIKGKTIGFLGATRVIPEYSWNAGASTPGMFSTYDPTPVLSEITKAKEFCDYLVVYVHWGVERATMPEAYQQTMGRQYIDAGADIVIGSHPHVLQGIEYYQGKPIVYSLGNFVFGSSIPKTMLLKVTLGEQGQQLSVLPCKSAMGNTVSVTDPGAVQAFYKELEGLSFDVTVTEQGVLMPDQP